MNWIRDFARLNETKETAVLTLITNCSVQLNDKGDKKLVIDIGSDPYIVPIEQKAKALSISRPSLYGRLKTIKKLVGITELASWDEPLVMGGGGVLPILTNNEGDKHILCFGRNIIPKGYNAACGFPDSFEESLNPESVIWREFSEELLIVDSQGCAFNLINAALPGLQYDKYIKQHTKLWGLKTRTKNVFITEYRPYNKWETEINYNNNSVQLKDAVWVINPTNGLINFIKPMRILIGDSDARDLTVYDCELNPDNPDKPLNRLIMAFNMNNIKGAYKYGAPEAVWWSGQNMTRMPLLHVVYDPIAAIRGDL
ncbi:MAG: hypothetical protein HYW34_01000 [Candidatus Brennerbacteria bacterium]|nr:hypothetical protein [Candidatus Brennerbacteria bacterium]